MEYHISYKQPTRHFIDIKLTITNIDQPKIFLQLPAWRPGRYEMQNFAKNIQKFSISRSGGGKNVPFRKVSKDRWEVDTQNCNEIIVKYNYYAFQMDSGNSWLDEEQLYINFINCMLYVDGRIKEACKVSLDLPDDYEIACGLEQSEKFNSCMLTFGPSQTIHELENYRNFLGLCSHELFHTWNIIRIRPAEMMPYDFTRENYFKAGFVAEGITTYYGDLALKRSGVFNYDEYFKELNTLLKRHYDNFGRFNLSVADSSYDLWLDGYTPGIPDRKVSIYVKGAIVAMILDLELRRLTNHEKSLDILMRYLWQHFGKAEKGYTLEDLHKAVEEIAGKQMEDYFRDFVYGVVPVEEKLAELLDWVGLDFTQENSPQNSERLFGFKVNIKDHAAVVATIEPGSVAELHLSREDEIVAVNGCKVNENFNELIGNNGDKAELALFRQQKLRMVKLKNKGESYFKQFRIALKEGISDEQKENLKKWLN